MDAYKSQPKYLDSSKILQTQQSHHKLIEYPLSPTKTIESIHSKKYSIKKVGTLDMKDDLTPVPCKSNISQQNFEVTITNKDTEIPKGKFAQNDGSSFFRQNGGPMLNKAELSEKKITKAKNKFQNIYKGSNDSIKSPNKKYFHQMSCIPRMAVIDNNKEKSYYYQKSYLGDQLNYTKADSAKNLENLTVYDMSFDQYDKSPIRTQSAPPCKNNCDKSDKKTVLVQNKQLQMQPQVPVRYPFKRAKSSSSNLTKFQFHKQQTYVNSRNPNWINRSSSESIINKLSKPINKNVINNISGTKTLFTEIAKNPTSKSQTRVYKSDLTMKNSKQINHSPKKNDPMRCNISANVNNSFFLSKKISLPNESSVKKMQSHDDHIREGQINYDKILQSVQPLKNLGYMENEYLLKRNTNTDQINVSRFKPFTIMNQCKINNFSVKFSDKQVNPNQLGTMNNYRSELTDFVKKKYDDTRKSKHPFDKNNNC